jgi:hypothetical protein
MATIAKPSDALSVNSAPDSALVAAAPSEGGNAIFQKLKQLLASYKSALRNSPLQTKALTSLVIGLLGELLGAYLRRRKFLATYKFASPASAPRLVDFKRLGIFGFYGLAITGPFFHWWYGSLEKFVRNQNIEGNGAQVATKILLDRLVMTPPFLLFTLFYMQGMLTMQPKQTVEGVKRAYPTALALNWKVWTVAQFVNFQYVPLDYRVLFGNAVAFWWNCYLSLIN